MLFNIYATHNKLSRNYETLFLFTTDEMAAKYIPLGLTERRKDLSEYEIELVGAFNVVTGELESRPHSIVPFSPTFVTDIPNSNPNVDDRKVYVECPTVQK